MSLVLFAGVGLGLIRRTVGTLDPRVLSRECWQAGAGGIVLNVVKEELPEERRNRFCPFVGSAAVYAVLLVT